VFEEKLAYQLDERMRDMHEMIDNCHNRVSKKQVIGCTISGDRDPPNSRLHNRDTCVGIP